MQKVFSIIITCVFFISCNDAHNEVVNRPIVQMAKPVAKDYASAKADRKDPVCEMPWDSKWKELTVYENDTIRFCSENCKKAFLARPQKYIKKQ